MNDHKKDGEKFPSFRNINEELGYYTVGQKYFINKAQAHFESQETKEQIYFYFNDSKFKNVDWYEEPTIDLYELYVRRAKQIREKYDYVCLYFSGGADSTAILKVFLDHNIKIDDIVFLGCINHDVKENHAVNAELYYTGMQYIRSSTQKNLKLRFVNLWDYFEEANNNLDRNWIFERSDARMAVCSILKEKAYSCDPVLLKQADKGKKVCLLMGLEKPRIAIKNDVFVFAFLDLLMYGNNYPKQFDEKMTRIVIERFYTSPDCIDLMKKQIHMIANFYIKNYPNDYKDHLIQAKNFDSDLYYTNIRPVLYGKYWNENNFSCGKANENFFGTKWAFMKKYKDSNYFKQWDDGLQHMRQNLSSDLYDADRNVLSGIWSKEYAFKKCPQ